MIVQDAVWLIWSVGTGLIVLLFLWVMVQAGKSVDDEARRETVRRSHRLQAWAFGFLLVVFAIGSWATLHEFPIPSQRTSVASDHVVDVVGHMWYWQLSSTSLEAGKAIEFRVTSGDVNHGFAIYSPQGHILTQTQAMPGYTNRLVYTFNEPGTYTIQCLEYCGMGHEPMKTTFEVVAAKGE